MHTTPTTEASRNVLLALTTLTALACSSEQTSSSHSHGEPDTEHREVGHHDTEHREVGHHDTEHHEVGHHDTEHAAHKANVASGSHPHAEPESRYKTTGEIVEVAEDLSFARIHHEDIPGYMPAMTMAFLPATRGQLEGFSTEDRVEFTFVAVKDEGFRIEEISLLREEGEPPRPPHR
ncbi:MAG: copper-binding protein [Myxococcota bacterium]